MIYLASPYSHPDPQTRQNRFEVACRVAALLTYRGRHVYSPIAHNHSLIHHGFVPPGFDYWGAADLEMVALCEEIWVIAMKGTSESKGVAAEIAEANRLGKKIVYVDLLGWPLPSAESANKCPHCGSGMKELLNEQQGSEPVATLTYRCGHRKSSIGEPYPRPDSCRIKEMEWNIDETAKSTGFLVRCCEGGGPENLLGTLALSVAKLRMAYDGLKKENEQLKAEKP